MQNSLRYNLTAILSGRAGERWQIGSTSNMADGRREERGKEREWQTKKSSTRSLIWVRTSRAHNISKGQQFSWLKKLYNLWFSSPARSLRSSSFILSMCAYVGTPSGYLNGQWLRISAKARDIWTVLNVAPLEWRRKVHQLPILKYKQRQNKIKNTRACYEFIKVSFQKFCHTRRQVCDALSLQKLPHCSCLWVGRGAIFNNSSRLIFLWIFSLHYFSWKWRML